MTTSMFLRLCSRAPRTMISFKGKAGPTRGGARRARAIFYASSGRRTRVLKGPVVRSWPLDQTPRTVERNRVMTTVLLAVGDNALRDACNAALQADGHATLVLDRP